MAFKSPLRGVQAWRRRQDLALGGAAATYADKVLGYGPIAYWPLWEASGTTAQCLVNSAQNGTYSSDVSTWPVGTGIGDGNTAPGFDGANDYVSLDTATLIAAFNGTTGTAVVWSKVASGAWTDGAARRMFSAQPGAELWYIRKNAANNQMRYAFIGNGVGGATDVARSATAWMCLALTWNGANAQGYYNGAADGAAIAINAWAGALSNILVGAVSVAPAEPWHGQLAHGMLFDRVLSSSDLLDLASV